MTLTLARLLPEDDPNPNPNQVLNSLDALKKTHRFDWLVEMCTQYQDDDDLDNKAYDDARATTDIRRRKPDGGGGGSGDGGDPKDTRALRRVKGIETASCCLSLINAIISFPESLADRSGLRSEFINLSMLDVLRLRPKCPGSQTPKRPPTSLERHICLLGAGPCAPGGAPLLRGCRKERQFYEGLAHAL